MCGSLCGGSSMAAAEAAVALPPLPPSQQAAMRCTKQQLATACECLPGQLILLLSTSGGNSALWCYSKG